VIIRSVRIRRFKKLVDQVLECRPGLNVLHGRNDAGKSTLHLAFSAVLYPVRPSEVKTYEPWGEGDPGEITLEFEAEGRAYRLHKDLRSRKALLEGGEVPIEDPRRIESRIGELLGLQSLSLFRATAHISQWDLAGVQKEQQEIGTRLARIVTGGDADAARVLTLLEDKVRRLEVGLQRPSKTPGPLRRDQDRLQSLAADQQRLAQEVDGVERAAAERDRLAVLIRDLRAQVADDDALLDANRRRLDLDAQMARAGARAAELQALLERTTRAARDMEAADRDAAVAPGLEPSLDDHRTSPESVAGGARPCDPAPGPRWSRGGPAGLGIAAVLAGVVAAAALLATGRSIWDVAGVVLFLLLVVAAAASWMRAKDAETIRREAASREALQQSLTLRAEERRRSVRDRQVAAHRLFDDLLGGRPVEEIAAEHQQVLLDLGTIKAQRDDPDLALKQLDPAAFQRRETEAAARKRRLAETEAAFLRLEGRLGTRLPHEDLARVEEDIAETRDRLGRYQRLAEVLRLTRAVLFEAHRSTIVPGKALLEERAGHYLRALSAGAYDRVVVDEHTLAPRVWVGPPKEWADVAIHEVGSGAVDQCYLALRLALLDVLCDDRRPPLFLDDPFLAYDEHRMVAALRLLRELGRDRQIFLLTCRADYHRYADHLIVLEDARAPIPLAEGSPR